MELRSNICHLCIFFVLVLLNNRNNNYCSKCNTVQSKIETLLCCSFFAQITVAKHHQIVLEAKGFLKKAKTKEFYWTALWLWALMGQTTSLPLEMLLLLRPITRSQKMAISLSMPEKDTMKNMSLFPKKRKISCLLEMV